MKVQLKSLAGSVLSRSGLYHNWMDTRGLVVLFHRVDDRLAGDPISCTQAEFRTWCSFLKDHFKVVSLTDFVDRLKTGKPVGGHAAITFDDGYLDNFTAAAPELSRQGLPGCFFISTEFIASNRVPWWDEKLPFRPEWMSWDQVRELRSSGFEIGCHTMNHVHMGEVGEEEARREVTGSRDRLVRELGETPAHFSYPYGTRGHINSVNHRVIRQAGFGSCFSAYGGLVYDGDDPMAIQRLPISPWFRTPGQLLTELIMEARSRSHIPEKFAA